MTQTAEVIKFARPVVKADIDKGFDRLAGTLTDALAINEPELNGREFQLVMAIISKTYRYHKPVDWIARCQLEEITGISGCNISTVLKSLKAKRVVIAEGRKIGINKVVSDWCKLDKKQSNVSNSKPSKNVSDSKQDVSDSKQDVSDSKPQSFNSDPHNRKTTKQKTTKQKIRESSAKKTAINLPEHIPRKALEDFIANRAKLKKPMTDRAVELLIDKLTTLHTQGHNLTELLNEAIMNGWQSVYPGKTKQSASRARPENFSSKDYGNDLVRF